MSIAIAEDRSSRLNTGAEFHPEAIMRSGSAASTQTSHTFESCEWTPDGSLSYAGGSQIVFTGGYHVFYPADFNFQWPSVHGAIQRRIGTGSSGMTRPLACVGMSLVLLCSSCGLARGEEPALFVSERITPKNAFTRGIEGPAVDAAGNLFAVNLKPGGNIGKLTLGAATPELFAKMPVGSKVSGIRFGAKGEMYVADYKGHNILVFEAGNQTMKVHFHSESFNQPNDLAIAPDGTLYASDPKFSNGGSGRIWKITKALDTTVRGVIMSSHRAMGTTNGLDVSADGKTLYVGEATTSELWAYDIAGNELKNERLLRKFVGGELDGLRLDADGRIFVTRNGKGKIAVIAPDGTLVRQIATLGSNPSNLSFGGLNGKTVFVTQVDGGFIEAFRSDRPGREFCLQNTSPECP